MRQMRSLPSTIRRHRPIILAAVAVLCLVGSMALDAYASRVRVDGYPTLRVTTTSGAPSTGCCSMVGDLSVDSGGDMYHCTALGCPGTWQVHGTGGGDLLADGSVAMTADFDLDGNDLVNVGAGMVSVETLAGNVDGLVSDVGDLTSDVGDLTTDLGTVIATPQCSSMPFVFADGSNNDVDVAYPAYNATDHQVYRVVTSNNDDDDIEVGECFCAPAIATAFSASNAATLTYKLSDGTGGNGVKLRVRGTDGATCYTSSGGTSTSEATIAAAASDLSTCVKTAGGLICVSAFVDTLDSADTASIGLITLKME